MAILFPAFLAWSSEGVLPAVHDLQRCDVQVLDVPPHISAKLVNRKRPETKAWATNNVERNDDTFQYGVDFWMHRHLTLNQENNGTNPAPLHYLPIYFSFIHIFHPEYRDKALRVLSSVEKGPSTIVPHGHPGVCADGSKKMTRLVTDTTLCVDTQYSIPVPYVVSHPPWLLAPRLPVVNRTNLLFFRGHLPKNYIDKKQVRAHLYESLKNVEGIIVEAATSTSKASYVDHQTYLDNMLRSKFCLCPRGDTAGSKRLYESIVAGCIPVIVSDGLELPFKRHIDWPSMSVRISETEALRNPVGIVDKLKNMPTSAVRSMHTNLLRNRHAFVWAAHDSRKQAVDYIWDEMCQLNRT